MQSRLNQRMKPPALWVYSTCLNEKTTFLRKG
jgi:hypothetical protein